MRLERIAVGQEHHCPTCKRSALPRSLLPFELERDLRIDAEVLDLVVLDRGLEFLDVDGGDPVEGAGRLGDDLPCGVLPAPLALAPEFDDLPHRHSVSSWAGSESSPQGTAARWSGCRAGC